MTNKSIKIILLIFIILLRVSKFYAENNGSLVAKITFPERNSLVRGDVPIFGKAYGNNFKKYRLRYGEGVNPKEWILITEGYNQVKEGLQDFKFKPQIGSIHGNLGTWETGLDNYYYKDYNVNLNGIYTLRLTVESKSEDIVEDRVTIEIGQVVTNVFGGVVKSKDDNAIIDVLEHSLYETAVIMSINSIDRDKIKLVVDPPYKLIGNIYEIQPSAWQFARDIILKIKYKGEGNNLSIYEYDLVKCQWAQLETVIESGSLLAKIRKLASGRSYYAILYNPNTKSLGNSHYTQNEVIECREYSDVAIEYDNTIGIDNVKCLKFTNKKSPGYFASIIRGEKFNAKEYPIIKFDYKIPPDLRINILAKVLGRWYEIEFTDTPKSYLRINMKKIGKIMGVKADNQWHTVKFNLYNMLTTQTRKFEVQKIIMADFDSSGYMELMPGHNQKGMSYYISNFHVRRLFEGEIVDIAKGRQGANWELGVDDGSPDEFSYEKYEGQYKESDTNDNFYVGNPYGEMERAIAFDDSESNIYFNLNKEDLGGKTYLLYLDACHCDLHNAGYVEFGVWLNGTPLGKFICIYEKGDIWGIHLKKELKVGQNKLTLRWLSGDNWVAWDYIKFGTISEQTYED